MCAHFRWKSINATQVRTIPVSADNVSAEHVGATTYSFPFKTTTIIALCAALVSGCGWDKSTATFFNPGQRIQGPTSVVAGEKIERVDLITELAGEADFKSDMEPNIQLALAYDEFYKNLLTDNLELKRNRIQGRLLQASDQACGAYINFLRQFETEGEFWLGSLATALAGAGAIVTGATAARSLSGSAGIFEGVRAEFRQAFFSNLATHVIVPGIEHRRAVILETSVTGGKAPATVTKNRNSSVNPSPIKGGIFARQMLTIFEYPVELAIKDAIFYHAHCNLMAGLVEASELIELGKRPGISAMNASLKEMGETRSLVDLLTGRDTNALNAANAEIGNLQKGLGDAVKTHSELATMLQKVDSEGRESAAEAFNDADGKVSALGNLLSELPDPVAKFITDVGAQGLIIDNRSSPPAALQSAKTQLAIQEALIRARRQKTEAAVSAARIAVANATSKVTVNIPPSSESICDAISKANRIDDAAEAFAKVRTQLIASIKAGTDGTPLAGATADAPKECKTAFLKHITDAFEKLDATNADDKEKLAKIAKMSEIGVKYTDDDAAKAKAEIEAKLTIGLESQSLIDIAKAITEPSTEETQPPAPEAAKPRPGGLTPEKPPAEGAAEPDPSALPVAKPDRAAPVPPTPADAPRAPVKTVPIPPAPAGGQANPG